MGVPPSVGQLGPDAVIAPRFEPCAEGESAMYGASIWVRGARQSHGPVLGPRRPSCNRGPAVTPPLRDLAVNVPCAIRSRWEKSPERLSCRAQWCRQGQSHTAIRQRFKDFRQGRHQRHRQQRYTLSRHTGRQCALSHHRHPDHRPQPPDRHTS